MMKTELQKQELLRVLREAEGYVSGQGLCEKFQVSRTAVWKKIRQLQDDGYEIEAVQNLGYRLAASPDTICAQEVASRMNTRWIGRDVRYFSSIDSTNRAAKTLGEQGENEGILVVADEQTAGRGRSGRSWSTPPGTAISMSLLLRPQIPPERVSMVTLIMGIAVTQAVRSLYPVEAGIKWPNDVVAEGRKISGTLTEMSCELMAVNYIVIGTGINANIDVFPAELEDKAISLSTLLGKRIDRAQLIAAVMEEFEKRYESFLTTQDLSLLTREYDQLLLNIGREVRVLQPGHEFNGVARGIDRMGQLLVEREDGTTESIYAGEVSVRGLYGYV